MLKVNKRRKNKQIDYKSPTIDIIVSRSVRHSNGAKLEALRYKVLAVGSSEKLAPLFLRLGSSNLEVDVANSC